LDIDPILNFIREYWWVWALWGVAVLWAGSLLLVRHFTLKRLAAALGRPEARLDDLSMPLPDPRPQDQEALSLIREYRRRRLLKLWPNTRLSFKEINELSQNLVADIARIYYPEEERPELKASLADLAALYRRVGVRLSAWLETVPFRPLKDMELSTVLLLHGTYQRVKDPPGPPVPATDPPVPGGPLALDLGQRGQSLLLGEPGRLHRRPGIFVPPVFGQGDRRGGGGGHAALQPALPPGAPVPALPGGGAGNDQPGPGEKRLPAGRGERRAAAADFGGPGPGGSGKAAAGQDGLPAPAAGHRLADLDPAAQKQMQRWLTGLVKTCWPAPERRELLARLEARRQEAADPPAHES
jgi:hypothetical protein